MLSCTFRVRVVRPYEQFSAARCDWGVGDMAPRIFLRHVSCWLEHLHFSWDFRRLLVCSRSAVVCSQSVSETCYRGCLFLSRIQPNARGGSHCAVAPRDKGTPSLSFVYYRSSDLSSTALWWRPEGHRKCSLFFFFFDKKPCEICAVVMAICYCAHCREDVVPP